MKVLVCSVVISVGDWYRNSYNSLFRPSQEKYAQKYKLDFKVVEEMIDTTVNDSAAFSFQKILVCDKFPEYDYIVIIDSDILINPRSPNIMDFIDPLSKNIYITDEHSWPSHEERNLYDGTATDYYNQTILPDGKRLEINTSHLLNTGVMVLQPRYHRKFLFDVYTKYIQGCTSSSRGYHYEQSTVGYEIQKAFLFSLLPIQFNYLWTISVHMRKPETIQEFFEKSYFMHFAGRCQWEEIPKKLLHFFNS